MASLLSTARIGSTTVRLNWRVILHETTTEASEELKCRYVSRGWCIQNTYSTVIIRHLNVLICLGNANSRKLIILHSVLAVFAVSETMQDTDV